ncbi:MAG: hypothetical protein R2755_17260 [Acidimicrobiales bacterium]
MIVAACGSMVSVMCSTLPSEIIGLEILLEGSVIDLAKVVVHDERSNRDLAAELGVEAGLDEERPTARPRWSR